MQLLISVVLRPLQEAQDIFGDVNELLEMYESRKAAGAAARCGS